MHWKMISKFHNKLWAQRLRTLFILQLRTTNSLQDSANSSSKKIRTLSTKSMDQLVLDFNKKIQEFILPIVQEQAF